MNEHTQKGHIAPGNGPPAARSRIVRAVAVASWLYLASALAAWALLYQGDLKWPATLLMFSPRWLLALPALVLALAAARWQRRSLVPVLIGLAVVLGPVMGLNVPWEDLTSEAPEGPRLRVLTCNMHYGRGDREALGALVMHSRPDVVALQEWRDKELPDALTGPYWHIRRSPGLFLASNSPSAVPRCWATTRATPRG